MSEEINWVMRVEVVKLFHLWDSILLRFGPTNDGVPVFLYMFHSVKVGWTIFSGLIWWFTFALEFAVKLCLFYLWLSVHYLQSNCHWISDQFDIDWVGKERNAQKQRKTQRKERNTLWLLRDDGVTVGNTAFDLWFSSLLVWGVEILGFWVLKTTSSPQSSMKMQNWKEFQHNFCSSHIFTGGTKNIYVVIIHG